MNEAPGLFSVHPYRVGHLACVGRNKVFLWTPEQDTEEDMPCLTHEVVIFGCASSGVDALVYSRVQTEDQRALDELMIGRPDDHLMC